MRLALFPNEGPSRISFGMKIGVGVVVVGMYQTPGG